MTLAPGTKLGRYVVVDAIGAGGMGEVYKAKDTRLDRTVAIKVLAEHFAESPERKQRFEREAKAISQLNHPHICTLHDVGEQDGMDFLVMEYIEGETLADKLAKSALTLDEAIEYGIQISDGLDVAHRAGIVHRDLKPGNMMLTRTGIKILDFGLAKLMEEEADIASSDAPTRQKVLTADQAIIGTLQYMAPEQLEGRSADERSDVFAFGALLYEMITGRKAFEGQSQASLIAAILEKDPKPLSSTQSLAPPALDRVVTRCLVKDADRRWQSFLDLNEELKWIAEGGSRGEMPAPASRRYATLAFGLVGALVVASLATVLWSLLGTGTSVPDEVTRFVISASTVDGPRSRFRRVAFSPDGRSLVYTDADQLYLRHLDELEAKPIPGADGARWPFFSADGQWIGFAKNAALYKVLSTGGSAAV